MKEFIKLLCHLHQFPVSAFRLSPHRTGHKEPDNRADARSMFTAVLTSRGLDRRTIAELLGSAPNTISSQRRRHRARLLTDQGYRTVWHQLWVDLSARVVRLPMIETVHKSEEIHPGLTAFTRGRQVDGVLEAVRITLRGSIVVEGPKLRQFLDELGQIIRTHQPAL